MRYETYNVKTNKFKKNFQDQQQIRWNVFDVKPVPYDKCKKLYESTLQELEQQYPGWEQEQPMQIQQDMPYYWLEQLLASTCFLMTHIGIDLISLNFWFPFYNLTMIFFLI